MILFNKNALKNKLQHYKMLVKSTLARIGQTKEDVALQNKKADMASQQSFPASDPPGFVSKSSTDKELHQS